MTGVPPVGWIFSGLLHVEMRSMQNAYRGHCHTLHQGSYAVASHLVRFTPTGKVAKLLVIMEPARGLEPRTC